MIESNKKKVLTMKCPKIVRHNLTTLGHFFYDQASGEILSYSISLSPNKLLILDTLEKLKQNIDPHLNPILHSDQGWHYQLKYYRDALKTMGIEQSMSRKGNCHDNAPIESFFNLLKRECLYRYN
ncbi:DDE-type integrase/transposase/recombinase, partial [Companilactobacillus kedongensis]|uniref:DDE-type integrase/transposase/recombinase n=1 Tax=Companilactobacillus kedongensis TaxID=2486004 RepID=UPI0013DDD4A0